MATELPITITDWLHAYALAGEHLDQTGDNVTRDVNDRADLADCIIDQALRRFSEESLHEQAGIVAKLDFHDPDFEEPKRK